MMRVTNFLALIVVPCLGLCVGHRARASDPFQSVLPLVPATPPVVRRPPVLRHRPEISPREEPENDQAAPPPPPAALGGMERSIPPAASSIAVSQVYGNWCSPQVRMTISANTWTFGLPDGATVSYPISSMTINGTTIVVTSSVGKTWVTMEFTLASDTELVQYRGRQSGSSAWVVYNRPLSRC